MATELYALKIGISFEVDASLTPLIIEYDSSTSIHLILQEDPYYAIEGAIVEDIRRLLASLPCYSTCFVPHTTNRVANRLARYSLGQEALAYWFSDPHLYLQDCLNEDSPKCTIA
ncbi:hypothetical protein L3X38_010014 [Prunus dulcis]|uniref:RNase H type-1 domain-containing protein n=1 Tax=Prunus dulcis TaxID=3755 RepID=A0AAD4WGC2_PRUDU|nr:hypothetical protein L3X38_010014 [Prunus dulcis]